MLTHGELFAGISGFGLGFGRSDIKTLWHVEIDKNCQHVLRRHYPDAQIFSDVRECGKHNLEHVDIISFGSPCQNLSVAGNRQGLKGEQSGLFYEAIRIVKELRPTLAIWENVPGAFSTNNGRDFAAVLSAFQECGASDIAWATLDAQYFGVPLRRRRIFLVADFGGERAAEILFESASSTGYIETSREARKDITGVLSSRTKSGFPGTDESCGGFVIPVSMCLSSRQERIDAESQTLVIAQNGSDIQVGTQLGAVTAGQAKQTTGDLVAYTIQSNDGGNHRRKDRPEGGLYINETDKALTVGSTDLTCVAYNWQSGGDTRLSFGLPNLQANQVPAVGVRRLTPVECCRLQGFPDDWNEWGVDEGEDRIEISDSTRYRQLGNAVCVSVAEYIGKQIVKILTKGEEN